jgi:hypothetical protein
MERTSKQFAWGEEKFVVTGFPFSSIISKARKRDKPKPGRMALFRKFSPSGPKKEINVYLRILS